MNIINRPLYSPIPLEEYNNEIVEANENFSINYYKKFNKYFLTLSAEINCIIFFAITNTILFAYLLKFYL